MSLNPETPIKIFQGDGVATSFDHVPTFTLSDPSNIAVYLDKAQTTDFTKTETGVLFAVPPAPGVRVILLRVTPNAQPSETNGLKVFDLIEIESALDYLGRVNQEKEEALSRVPVFPVGVSIPELTETSIGIGADGEPVARTKQEEIEHLGIAAEIEKAEQAANTALSAEANLQQSFRNATFWNDEAERLTTIPTVEEQLGVQRDNKTLWISNGLNAGDWRLIAPFDQLSWLLPNYEHVILLTSGDYSATGQESVSYAFNQPVFILGCVAICTEAPTGSGAIINISEIGKFSEDVAIPADNETGGLITFGDPPVVTPGVPLGISMQQIGATEPGRGYAITLLVSRSIPEWYDYFYDL